MKIVNNQLSFDTYKEAKKYLWDNKYKSLGYLKEEPFASYFIEEWLNDNYIARCMNGLFVPGVFPHFENYYIIQFKSINNN